MDTNDIASIKKVVEYIVSDVEALNELGLAIDAEAFASMQAKVARIDERMATMQYAVAKQIEPSVERLKAALSSLRVKPSKAQS